MNEAPQISAAPETEQETESTGAHGKYNRAAIRRQALLVSTKTMLGKKTRVSEEFIDFVLAGIEALAAKLRGRTVTSPLGQVDPEEKFLTGEGEQMILDAVNVWIAREIHAQANLRRGGKTF